MKNALLITAVVLVASACNFTKKQTKPRVQLVTHKEAADTMRIAGLDTLAIDSLTALIEYGYITPEKSKAILQKVDYTNFLFSGMNDDVNIFNGFYGDDRYRIEFYISGVAVDTANPFVVKLSGKSKYKENINEFMGTVTIDSLFAYRDLTYNYREFVQYLPEDTTQKFEGDTTTATYHAKGTFSLAEDSNQANAGNYSGQFYMDFIPRYNDEREIEGYNLWFNTDNNSRRAGFLFDGQWTSYKNGEQKPVIFARDLFMFANQILENFSYGEREIEINEKYRALGWENYWEAEEWWSDKNDTKLMMILPY